MSLRCVGNQLLQTAPSTLLAGASQASLSLWICVNADNNITNPNGVEIFGDGGGKLTATLSGTGNLKLQWSSVNGGSAGRSSCTMILTPGMSYHLAAVWKSGAQIYYLNGVEVQSDTQAGLIGVVGDNSPHPYRLGSDSSGTDVVLGDPTLWVGYGLTAQDVHNLGKRTVQPSAIAPSSIASLWSLTGQDGVAVQVGHPGLADASSHGLNLSTVIGSAPTYQAASMNYGAPPTIGRAMVAPSGQAIALLFEDGSGNNTNVSSVQSGNDIQTISVVAPPTTNSLALTFKGQTTASIPITMVLPGVYGQFVVPVTPGKTYAIAVTFNSDGGCCTEAIGEVYDSNGITRLGFATYPTRQPPTSFTHGLYSDPPCGGSNVSNDSPVPWQAIATVTPTGSTITVRLSATTDGVFFVEGLLVEDVAAGTYAAYSDGDPTVFTAVGALLTVRKNWGSYFQGNAHIFFQGLGLGSTFRVDPAAMQSALQALSTVQPGGVQVWASDALGALPITIEFVGPMGGAAQPAMTASDPSFSIVNTAGAAVPSISINGGPSITLKDWVWAGNIPWAICPLHQATPAEQILKTRQGNFSSNGWWAQSFVVSNSLSDEIFQSNSSGDVAHFPFQALPPATYQAAVTWPASASLSTTAQFLVQDGSGNTLATYTVDQTKTPDDYTSLGHGWKVLGSFTTNAISTGLTVTLTVANSNQSVCIDAVQLSRTSVDSSVIIAPTDSVKLSVPSGWVTTAAGPIAASSGQPLTNLVGGSMLPTFVPTRKTMQVGFNIDPDVYYSECISFANMSARITQPIGVTQDHNGYPLSIHGGNIQALVTEPGGNSGGNGKSGMNAPNGRYTLLWDGASVLNLGGYDGTGVYEVGSLQNITGGLNNHRVYDVQASPLEYSPRMYLNISGTGPDPSDPSGQNSLCDFKNLRIYPPDPADPTGSTAWVNPPKFHPSFLYKLQGVSCIRFMDPLRTNENPYRDFADIKPATGLTRGDFTRIVQLPIVSCQAYTGPTVDYPTAVMIKVTTPVPHTLFDGCFITLYNAGTATLSDGTSFVMDFYHGIGYGLVTVIDETSFAWHATSTSTPNQSMTNTTTGGSIQATIGTPYALQDVVDLCNTVGADCWLNLPTTVSDACVNSIADFFAANLAPGKKVHLEYGNECWNFQFFTYVWMKIKNFQLVGATDGSYVPAYVFNAKRVHDLFAARFAAAGRPNDMIYTFCTQAAATDRTYSICQYANQYGARIDELGCAPYFDNIGSGPANLYDFMTPDQCLDVLELNTFDGGYQYVAEHRSVLDANGFTAANLVCYEGGPESLLPAGANSNYFPRHHAVHRHPRMYGIILYYLQRLENEGCKLFNDFYAFSAAGRFAWSAYEWYNSPRGTGDPTIDVVNVTDPEALDTVASEVGGAIHHWCTLLGLPLINPHVDLHNGKPTAIGNRRGQYRQAR